jgi:hypothetical protein
MNRIQKFLLLFSQTAASALIKLILKVSRKVTAVISYFAVSFTLVLCEKPKIKALW